MTEREARILHLLAAGVPLCRTGVKNNAEFDYSGMPRYVLSPILGPMVSRGLVRQVGESYALTEKGREEIDAGVRA